MKRYIEIKVLVFSVFGGKFLEIIFGLMWFVKSDIFFLII